MRAFTKITPAMWTLLLSMEAGDTERLLWLYYCTGRHQTIAGVSHAPDAYVAEDLRWTVEKCKNARTSLMKTGAITFDANTSEVLVEGWWTYNGPTNEKHLKGCQAGVAAIASDSLRQEAGDELAMAWERREAARRGIDPSKPPPKPPSDPLAARKGLYQ